MEVFELRTKDQLKSEYIDLAREMNRAPMTVDLDEISDRFNVLCAQLTNWKSNVAIYVCGGLSEESVSLSRKWLLTDPKKAIDLYREYIDDKPVQL